MPTIKVLTNLDNLNTKEISTDKINSKSLYIINNLLHIAENSNNIGINTDDPQHSLHVNGSFASNTKSFIIPHPVTNSNYNFLRYGSLESPYHGIRLTGKNVVINNYCKVDLPYYISSLVLVENVSIQLTNYKHDKILFVDEINIKDNYFEIKANDYTNAKLEFFWSFTAIRQDVDPLVVEF